VTDETHETTEAKHDYEIDLHVRGGRAQGRFAIDSERGRVHVDIDVAVDALLDAVESTMPHLSSLLGGGASSPASPEPSPSPAPPPPWVDEALQGTMTAGFIAQHSEEIGPHRLFIDFALVEELISTHRANAAQAALDEYHRTKDREPPAL